MMIVSIVYVAREAEKRDVYILLFVSLIVFVLK